MTRPIGAKGVEKKNVSVTLSIEEKELLDALAYKSQMSRNEYVRRALKDWLDNETYYEPQTVTKTRAAKKVAR
jgi:predicted transcriptional regulator